MPAPASFSLYQFITSNAHKATAILAGSATPGLSLSDLTALSNDHTATSQVFKDLFANEKFNLGPIRGREQLRENISQLYNTSSKLTADNVIVANGTTGANHILYRSLLTAGDHVIVQYPTYGPLIEEPRDIGCEISYFRLDPSKGWSPGVDRLRSLVKPGKTKMIVLNNPANPTGTHLESDVQKSIIEIAKEHNIAIHCDEIFRPFFHATSETEIPPSLNEHADLDYDNIVTTGSLSKCFGLSGVRVGWICTRSQALYEKFVNYRMFSVQSLSQLDEIVAGEALGRCKSGIIKKHLTMAKHNLDLIGEFVTKYSDQCEWVRPTAGAVAFVKFKDHRTGEPVDDVDFCLRLLASKKVLLSPATACFELVDDDATDVVSAKGAGEFKGRTRVHFTTTTSDVERGLKGLGEFLEEERKGGTANGTN